MSDSAQVDVDPVWCVIANIRDETAFGPHGEDSRVGHKHFSPGTKVYCFPVEWGDGYEHVRVVAQHRGSRKFVTMVIDSKYLTNWRVILAYHPHVVAELAKHPNGWDGSRKSKRRAEALVILKGGTVKRDSWRTYFSKLFRRTTPS